MTRTALVRQKVVFIDSKKKRELEAFFARMSAEGKLNDSQMNLIEESIPGFRFRPEGKKPTF